MTLTTASTAASGTRPSGLAFPATARNNRVLMDALKDAAIDTQADKLGVDRAEYRKGNLVHTNAKYRRFDQYADDTSEDRFARQFKGETRAEQLARRLASAASPTSPVSDGSTLARSRRAPFEACDGEGSCAHRCCTIGMGAV